MTEKPILLFPTNELAQREKKKSSFHSLKLPTFGRQVERLTPKFNLLQQTFESDRNRLQIGLQGADPEYVLVFETVGSIENFANAIKKIDGFEWMGEIEIDDITPDEDFYDSDENRSLKLNGRLYLMMSNYQALRELLSLWQRYANDRNYNFPYGQGKFKNLFEHLKEIRKWDERERIHETGMIEYWRSALIEQAEERIAFEIELWYRKDEEKRIACVNNLTNKIMNRGGRVENNCVIKEIGYHSLSVELPRNQIENLLNEQDIELIKAEEIMFFRPTGQIIGGKIEENYESATYNHLSHPIPPDLPPIIAVFDGFPQANHEKLQNRLIIDDPDDFESSYQGSERMHGTSMASLIIHGDLNDNELPLQRRIYFRPIMKPFTSFNGRIERIPNDVNILDLILRSVRRLFESEGGNEPIAPSIKIINLSICDSSRPFVLFMSPWAKLLDYLSDKYNILFIVSAGNQGEDIQLQQPYLSYAANMQPQIEADVVNSLYSNSRNRRILTPAESINSITVGSLHNDGVANYRLGYRFDAYTCELPSPFSPFGSGYRKSIKPDLLYMGGKQLFKVPIRQQAAEIEFANYHSAPGNLVAASGTQRNNYIYTRGTSNSAALITHEASICFDILTEIFNTNDRGNDFDTYSTVILKAMIVHGCSWTNIGENLKTILAGSVPYTKIKSQISRWLGYGVPDYEKIKACTNSMVTLIGYGELITDNMHVYDLPIPTSLNALKLRRKMTITLAWFSPIRPFIQRYREANLYFEFDNDFVKDRVDVPYYSARKGTLQHEIFEKDNVVVVGDNDVLKLKIICKDDAGKISKPIKYGLFVTMEIMDPIDIDIYNEIRQRIRPQIQLRN